MKILDAFLSLFVVNIKEINYAPYSFSKIDTWLKCPHKFQFKYINKINVPYEPNLALLIGSFIHSCIEHNNNGTDYKLTGIFTKEEKEKATKIVNNFRDSEIGKYYLEQNGKHEVSFAIKNKNDFFQTSSYYDLNVLLKGKIDYIFVKDDELNIIDWKSGKYIENESQNFNQLILYAIWGFLNYKNIDSIKCAFVYVEHQLENSYIYKRESLSDYIKIYNHYINDIESDSVFSKVESNLCEYCEYRRFDYCKKEVNA